MRECKASALGLLKKTPSSSSETDAFKASLENLRSELVCFDSLHFLLNFVVLCTNLCTRYCCKSLDKQSSGGLGMDLSISH